VNALTRDEKLEIIELAQELTRRRARNRLKDYLPYGKQKEFHDMGAVKRERMLAAGNQLGKTYSAASEVAIHLTGRYPDGLGRLQVQPGESLARWLGVGRAHPPRCSAPAPGKRPEDGAGHGQIPADSIIAITWSRHVNELVDTVKVRHAGGGVSTISLKSYDQGRGKWQADTVDGVWFDEEPPEDIYFEGITRTNVTFGPVLVTCTLLKGMTAIAARFWKQQAEFPSVGLVVMTIYDVGHYSDEERAQIIASYPAHEREARTMGTPSLGSGRIFPVTEESIKVEPFAIPDHWAQIGGMDFGYDHPFGAVRLAWDRDADVIYVTATYRKREATPIIHAAALRPWGDWLPWAWPHDGLQHDKGSGEELADQYRKQQLNLLPERATFEDGGNGVEVGVLEMLDRMMTGRLKVFSHLADWFEEFRMYHRKDGKIVKLMDDVLSATRYAMMMIRHATTSQPAVVDLDNYPVDY
jgi:phage terminase large subunit-like protein